MPISLWYVASQMVVVSLPILLGWGAHKLGFMDEAFDARLSQLILNICLPCMILASVATSTELPTTDDMLAAMLAATVLCLVCLAVAFALTALLRVPCGAAGAYRFMVAFGNCGFIGFPVISAVYGSEALLIAAIGLIPLNFFIYSAGVMMFSGAEGGLKRQMRSIAACFKIPAMMASLVVLACTVTRFTGFGVLGQSLDIVGQLTTPAALLLVGSSIARYSPLSMFSNPRAYVAALGRLLVAPLVGLLVLKLLMPVDPGMLGILVLQSAMPVATNGTLFCLQYGVDTKPMMQGTFLSIVASIATIPVVVVLAGM